MDRSSVACAARAWVSHSRASLPHCSAARWSWRAKSARVRASRSSSRGTYARVEAPMADPRPPRILVVDDTEGNRYATSRIPRAADFDVSEASTGREALEAMRTRPDVLVLDVNLPDMTGFEVVERLRA